MQLNIKKSSVMWFKPHAQLSTLPPDFMIDSEPLSVVTSQKYLGITFDGKLDWLVPFVRNCLFIYSGLSNSHRISLPTEVIKMLIDSLVLSRLIYAMRVWGPLISQFDIRIYNVYTTGAFASLPLLESLIMSQSIVLNFTG